MSVTETQMNAINPGLNGLDLETISNQTMAEVRAHPGEARPRILLAQLSMVSGQWQRALAQLQAAAQLDAANIPMAQAYREAIRCEISREQVFAGQTSASFVGEPEPWCGELAKAMTLRAEGQDKAADRLQMQALEQAEAVPFLVDDQPVTWLADADSRLGCICEVFLNGSYFWLPMQHIQSLKVDQPNDLRDLVWIPARLTLTNGGQHPVFLPSRYPNSYQRDEQQLALSKLTVWEQLSDQAWAGFGQRMWASDVGDHPLLDTRSIHRADSYS